MRVVLESLRAPEKIGSGPFLKDAPPYFTQVWEKKGRNGTVEGWGAGHPDGNDDDDGSSHLYSTLKCLESFSTPHNTWSTPHPCKVHVVSMICPFFTWGYKDLPTNIKVLIIWAHFSSLSSTYEHFPLWNTGPNPKLLQQWPRGHVRKIEAWEQRGKFCWTELY